MADDLYVLDTIKYLNNPQDSQSANRQVSQSLSERQVHTSESASVVKEWKKQRIISTSLKISKYFFLMKNISM
jgi:hypothetical protein